MGQARFADIPDWRDPLELIPALAANTPVAAWFKLGTF
jgi:hypothetical protein